MIEWLLLYCTEESSNINKISRKRAEKFPQVSDVTRQLVQRDSNNVRLCYSFLFFSFDLSKVFVASQGKQILRLYLKCYVLLLRKFNDHTIIKIRRFKYEMQI